MGAGSDALHTPSSPDREQRPAGPAATGTAAEAAPTLQGAARTLTPTYVLGLQRLVGNRAVTSLVRPERVRAVQRLRYNDPPTTWATTVTIERSKEGKEGVYFVRDGARQIVVKPLADVARVVFASRFMALGMDLDAPFSRTYSMLSTEGLELTRLFTTKPIRNEKYPGEAQDQIAKSKYWLVMKKVEGKSIQALDDNEATAFIHDDDALRAVGRIMVADAFLGNTDRLLTLNPNLGNFFYAMRSGVVRTIDNESRFELSLNSISSEVTIATKVDIVERLLDTAKPDGRKLYLFAFLERFKRVHRNHPGALAAVATRGEEAIKDEISEGVDEAFHDIARLFARNIDLVRAVAASPEAESRGERDPGSAKAIAHYIRARVRTRVAPDTAADQLKHYVEYRARRNKAPAGLKWVTRLFSDVGFSSY